MERLECPDGFAVFGWAREDGNRGGGGGRGSLLSRLQEQPVAWRFFDVGRRGRLFFHADHLEVAESADALVVKLGFLRSSAAEPLSAAGLSERRLVTPETVDHGTFFGNGLVVCLGKRQAAFTAYATLLALPQLYYAVWDEEILCATDLRVLLALMDRVEIAEEVAPMHFLFRAVLGEKTFFRGVRRLFHGRLLRWRDGDLAVRTVRDLRPPAAEPRFRRLDAAAVEWLHRRQCELIDSYLTDGAAAGRGPACLLSGGEDSSAVQLLLQERSDEASLSASFALAAPEFAFEIDYARQASELFGTRHIFVDVRAEDYPEWLQRALEILPQPALINESWPLFLALAHGLRERLGTSRDFFTGQGADLLHGTHELPELRLYERWRAVPGAATLFAWRARFGGNKKLRYVAEMLAADRASIPGSLDSAGYYMGLMDDGDMAVACFGEDAVRDALEYRLALEEEYLGSALPSERAQVADLVSPGYDCGVSSAQLLAARGLRAIHFSMDEEVAAALMAFEPEVRYFAHGRLKPLQKALLERGGKADVVGRRKGGTRFDETFFGWTRSGPLRDLVQAIEPPAFMTKKLARELCSRPDENLFTLLVYDLFVRLKRAPPPWPAAST